MSQEAWARRCRRFTPRGTHVTCGHGDNRCWMTKRLIIAAALVMLCTAATAYGAVTPIPPDQYPRGCNPNGVALQGDEAKDRITGGFDRDLLRGDGGSDFISGRDDADWRSGR
jgi:hypothetical protein